MTFNEFTNEYEKRKVIKFDNNVPKDVLVTICVETFNHENYITQCLDNILKQKTSFKFEILIGEDLSTDKTREICKKYALKYPNKIRLLLHHKENKIHINGKVTNRFNLLYNFYSARGKYIARCEGDDYWIDPYKLQKQVDFMKKNSNCKLCTTNAKYYYQEKNIFKDFNVPNKAINKKTNAVSLKYIFSKRGVVFPTATYLFRKEEILDKKFFNLLDVIAVGDRCIQLRAIIAGGDICNLEDQTTVYRVEFKGGSWTSANINKFKAEKLKDDQKRFQLISKLSNNKLDYFLTYADSLSVIEHIRKSGAIYSKPKQFLMLWDYRKRIKIEDLLHVVPRIIFDKNRFKV